MESVILVIHFIVTLALIGLVLLQKSEGGGLGIGGGGGGMGALAGAHSTANILTKATTLFAVAFFATNLTLAYIAKSKSSPTGVFDEVTQSEMVAPDAAMVTDEAVPATEEEPAIPAAPIAE